MDIVTFLIVGVIAGALASFTIGGGLGLFGDLCIGVAGAVAGGWVLREMHWAPPLSGDTGAVVVAALGAVTLLLAFRLVRRTSSRRV